MNFFYGSIEIIASFIEMFVLYKIYSVLLYKQRVSQCRLVDIWLAIGGAILTQICNHVASFSYFTLLLFVLYTSISSAFFYKMNYVALFSIASFYVLCLSCFDFMAFTLISNFYGGYETFVKLVSTMGVFRAVTISGIKVLWIMAYFFLKKYLYKFSLKKNHAYTILIISCAGFLGFIYLVNQILKHLIMQ